MEKYNLVAKTFAGLEQVLADELATIGAESITLGRRAVSFVGNKEMMYKANFCLRTALKILKPIAEFTVADREDLYQLTKNVQWSDYLALGKTFMIESTVQSEIFVNSMYASLRVKDAIADYFRESTGRRPSVNTENPDIIINLYLMGEKCILSLDSSGESLHKRGYRIGQAEASINEVLAAGMVMLAGWDTKTNLLDPMCGSGTILIEAAMIAQGIPPGIYRKSFAFELWPDFDKSLFAEIYNADYEKDSDVKIVGTDISTRNCNIAKANIKNAGLSKVVEIKTADFIDLFPPFEQGLIITNPPYGERLKPESITDLYSQIGTALKQKYSNYKAWIISSSEEGLKSIGLKPSKKIELFNGSIQCSYRCFEMFKGTRKEMVIIKKGVKY